MSTPDARRPSGSTESRADDRSGAEIRTNCTARPQIDSYNRSQATRWLAEHGLLVADRHSDRWVLAAPRPATFAEMVEMGAIDVDELAVPVGVLDAIGGA